MLTVLIFDSGVGGLSISQSLTDTLPSVRQVLLADNACFPYGEMDDALLEKRVSDLLLRAERLLQPDCIIVACNTVSTVALETIRNCLKIPVIGVVPAIKPAATSSSSKVIGLLATPATVARSYTADLVNDYADDCTLISVGNTRLVEIAEQRLRGIAVDKKEVEQILRPFIEAEQTQNLDTIVLGCTHFPLLSDVLAGLLPSSITLVDSSVAIARQAEKILQAKASSPSSNNDYHQCLLTELTDDRELETGLQAFHFAKPKLLI